MEFEWDEKKRAINLKKHQIDFVRVKFFFDNPTLEFVDKRHDYGETRIAVLGKLEEEVLYVVYTWRKEIRRLISARRAGYREKRIYYASYPRTDDDDER